LRRQFCFDVGGDGGAVNQALIGTFWFIVFSFVFRADPGFREEAAGGNKEVEERAEGAVEDGKGVAFSGSIETIVPGIPADDVSIFLFSETIIIFVTGTAVGEMEHFL
jgi:hypothetical protein